MTRADLERFAPRALIVAGGAAALFVVLALFDAADALRGLLAAFLACLSVPLGATVLLLIHRLTGGRWGELAHGELATTASGLFVTTLLFVPILFALPLVYPWAGNPAAVAHPDVARYYLNSAGFILRSVAALGLFALFAWAFTRFRRPPLAVAGIGLFVYGLAISHGAVDWVLSLDPHFKNTAFAMSLATSQLLSASAFMLLIRREDDQATADLVRLSIAFALGLFYLDMMQLLVAYDGNLPSKAVWYLRRATPFWSGAIALAFVGAVLVPFLAGLNPAWRIGRLRRAIGAAVLIGLLLRSLWLVLPEWDGGIGLWLGTLLALVAGVGLAIGVAFDPTRWSILPGRRLAHGA
ncbi:hypothetical protein [Mangrovibrevibacter kandeliae]|uniref:hypothetical protein n=1 Tax=Mangrovibrevibacter kandeliae TaxID=2968473 RepID=UPI002118B7CB|nr:hypothetical protein [Aurantimonas sp. CSK15Z-1]MCQ8783993.1 hypothetical protein [Aurantimonas sp. CSK15Z-1]